MTATTMIPAGHTKSSCVPAGIALWPVLVSQVTVGLLLGCLDAAAAHAATIGGRVRFDGPPPARPTITMSVDPACDRMFPKGRPSDEVIVDQAGGLSDVFVYVASGLPKDYVAPPATASAAIDLKGCAYVPHVLGVQVGQEIAIHNRDEAMHGVSARPVVNIPFAEALPAKDLVLRKSFAREEVAVKLKCDVHPWMSAYIGVFDHPFFTITGADGTFSITGLPEGEYTIRAWHGSLGARRINVVLDEEDSKTLDFSFVGN